ncbi:hypothetical protein ASD64_18875 [Mesorhizobium sp. Root157]|nr:hypothetical protein ASD64_18875 [Mesorhizobium sp. Root157]
MQQSLTLAASAPDVARLAITPHLRHVASHSFPSTDLAFVLSWQSASVEVAAIPLEPSAWIIRMDPALGPPDPERLTGIDAEVVQ